jgi:DNA-binding response OmpR family regulator
MTLHVLLLEDDDLLAEILEEFLLSLGYRVTLVTNGKDAEDIAFSRTFDLFILDVNVPYIDGFELLASLRAVKNETPAIFITSRSTPDDLKKGFGAGADDYIKKPFDLSELKLRIDNIKRHFNLENDMLTIDADTSLDLKNLSIIKGDVRYTLTKKDAEVLAYLLKHHDHVVSLEELGSNVWSYEQAPSPATLRTYIKNIRKILGEEYITNIKGVGYRFNKR